SRSARTIVLNAIVHLHNQRYELFAACVMPDHVHFLIQPWPKDESAAENRVFWKLSEILRSIKSYTAHQINAVEGTKGAIWAKEQFDRYVRSDRDLAEKFQYIVGNPWASRVVSEKEDYRWIWAG